MLQTGALSHTNQYPLSALQLSVVLALSRMHMKACICNETLNIAHVAPLQV